MCATIGNKAQKHGDFVKFSGVIFAKTYSKPQIGKIIPTCYQGVRNVGQVVRSSRISVKIIV